MKIAASPSFWHRNERKRCHTKKYKRCGLGMNYLCRLNVWEAIVVTGSEAKSSRVFKSFLFCQISYGFVAAWGCLFTGCQRVGYLHRKQWESRSLAESIKITCFSFELHLILQVGQRIRQMKKESNTKAPNSSDHRRTHRKTVQFVLSLLLVRLSMFQNRKSFITFVKSR